VLDPHQIEVFCRVFEEKSFTRAAERLGLSQPTVSSHVKSLEDELGGQLFDRLGRQIEPTSAARLLYEHAMELLALHDEVEERLHSHLHGKRGRLSIGASTIPGEHLLPRVLGGFGRRWPDIEIVVHVASTRQIIELVASGELELGIVGARAPNPDLDFEEVAVDRMVLAVPRTGYWEGHKSITLDELKKQRLILRERGSGTRIRFERQLMAVGEKLQAFNISVRLGSSTAVCEAVKAGLGVSVTSWHSVRSAIEAGTVLAVRVPELGELRRSFYRVLHQRRARSSLCDAFVEYLEAKRQTAAGEAADDATPSS